MGRLTYGRRGIDLEFDDLGLAHVMAVVLAKLRRTEPFLLTIWDDVEDDRTSTTLWMHPGSALRFSFDDEEEPPLDARLLERMLAAANTNRGVRYPQDYLAGGAPSA